MKLHLGCGEKFINGFVHIDLANYSHIDYRISVDNLDLFQDGTVELIYASHVLEHFGRNKYLSVLEEWYRVLEKGGVLRLAVPDFESVIKYYQKDDDLEKILGLLVGGQKNQYDYHKMIFTKKYLTGKLKEVGFRSMRNYDWRKTEHADTDDYSQAYLPHMDKESGMLMSLNLEALK